jgi:hypothetical protein
VRVFETHPDSSCATEFLAGRFLRPDTWLAWLGPTLNSVFQVTVTTSFQWHSSDSITRDVHDIIEWSEKLDSPWALFKKGCYPRAQILNMPDGPIVFSSRFPESTLDPRIDLNSWVISHFAGLPLGARRNTRLDVMPAPNKCQSVRIAHRWGFIYGGLRTFPNRAAESSIVFRFLVTDLLWNYPEKQRLPHVKWNKIKSGAYI